MTGDEGLIQTAARLSAALRPGDLDQTLNQITAAAVELLPEVHYASITVMHADGRLETVAPTDDLIIELDALQYDLREGPCYQSATETAHISAPDLAHDERFADYGRHAAARGIEAQAGIRLFNSHGSHGALNLYSRERGSFRDVGLLEEIFAAQSATALAYGREVSQLREAVRSRQMIGQAVGVVMGRFNLDEARAFGFLTRLAEQNGEKVRVVAERLLQDVAAQARPEES